jgi:drug/metabolite transporter (DMT)-like permease
MQTGLILALISALSFSIGIVIVRKASAAAGESFSVTALSILVGIPFFALAVTIAGDWDQVLIVSWRALALLGLAGIIHFIFGRLLGYSSYRLIGANKATPYISTSPFYTLLFSFLFLGESITVFIIAGVLCMFLGAALTSSEKKTTSGKKQGKFPNIETKGILLALGAALCWGITPILIKPGVEEMGSPIAASFITYCAAGVVMLGLLMRPSLRQQVTRQPLMKSLAPMVLAALFTAAGQLLMFTALVNSPASVVSPLMSTQVIFIFFLSLLVNRKMEIFSWKIALGMAATLAGTFLLFR